MRKVFLDYEGYRRRTLDEQADPDEVERLLPLACQIVSGLCGGRLAKGLRGLSPFAKEAARNAAAAQVRYLLENGGMEAAVNGAPSYGGFISLGGFSYGDRRVKEAGRQLVRDDRTSPLVLSYLLPAGLLYAGLGKRRK